MSMPQYSVNGRVVYETVCDRSNTLGFTVPGLNRAWVTVTQNGITTFDGILDLPIAPYTFRCPEDIGLFRTAAFSLNADGSRGNQLGQVTLLVKAPAPATATAPAVTPPPMVAPPPAPTGTPPPIGSPWYLPPIYYQPVPAPAPDEPAPAPYVPPDSGGGGGITFEPGVPSDGGAGFSFDLPTIGLIALGAFLLLKPSRK